MDEREKYDNGIFTVRFVGEELKTRGVSIYDLSNSLLAIQRIVHKAFLSQEGRLVKGAFPDKEERERLALQIGERRRTSDGFSLVSILSDPAVQDYLKQLAGYIISSVVGYYTCDVLDRLRREKDINKKIFICSIHTEITNIVNRVNSSGGVEAISLGSPALERETFASFNQDSKDYLRSLNGEFVLGDYAEIKGRAYKLYPASRIVAIHGEKGRAISVFLDEDNFDKIRYHKESNPLFVFKGRARYPFGVETTYISEFEAYEIEYLVEES